MKLYTLINLYQNKNIKISFIRFNNMYKVLIEDIGKGGMTFDYYNIIEAEEKYNSEVLEVINRGGE